MTNSKSTRRERTDVYDLVTNTIIERLEQGFIPWKKPWAMQGAARNFISDKPYKGINAMILNGIYKSPFFLTLKQANSLGGKIKKGSRSLPVTFWSKYYTHRETGAKLTEEQARAIPKNLVKTRSFLKYYRVFNATNITGIEFPRWKPQVISEADRIDRCEDTVRQMPLKPVIRHEGNQAYYAPMADMVTMPDIETFFNTEGYYQTLFHELAHSTGHHKRLKRKTIQEQSRFGSEDYSFEELIAEFTASFVSNTLELQNAQVLENSAAYIQNWLSVLKDDKTMLVRASAFAQKAADWILNESKVTA